jgi:integrase
VPRREPNKIKLNDVVIKNLKPKETRPYLVWDTRQHGLAVQVQPSGVKSWKCIYSRNSRPRWYSIGRCDAIGLSDARMLAGKVMVEVAQGGDPQADRKAKRTSGTFGDLAALYREYAMTKKERNKSWQQADRLVTKHLLPRWSKLKAIDIRRSDVRILIGGITAPIVANQTLAAASAIFKWAMAEDLVLLSVNPCIGVERNRTNKRKRILSESEIPKFWSAFGEIGYVEGMALRMILLLGQRPGEIAHLRTEHIVDGWWEMPGDPVPKLDWPGTKNAANHRVFLPAPALAILKEMDRTGLVFAGARGSAISGLDRDMREICDGLGIPEDQRATPHDLRRTHGSTVTGLGYTRDAMNRIQNHLDGGIADVYDQYSYAAENKIIMEAVANKFISLIDGGGANNIIAFGPTAAR